MEAAEHRRILLFLLLFCSPLAADTVTLKNGRRLDGTFLGGDARTVRFAVGPEVRSFPVRDIQVVTPGEPARIGAPETAPADGSGSQRQLCEAVLSFRPGQPEIQQ